MLKKDLETRRISRIGSLIVPPPRRADGANAFLTRVSFAGSTSLLIKQKSAAQGNIEETSGCLADATNWGITKDVPPRSRGAMRPSLARVHPRKREGAGNAGCALHPRSRVQDAQGNAHTSIQVQRRHPASPARWLYGLCRALPGDEFVLSPSSADLSGSSTPVGFEFATADLAPATGVRTTRFCRTLKRRSSCAVVNRSRGSTRPATAVRADAVASTTSHSAFVTTRDRPSCRNGMARNKSLIWGLSEAEFCPSCQSVATRRATACRSATLATRCRAGTSRMGSC